MNTNRPSVSFIGAGRVGTALAVLLAKAGYQIAAISGGDATRERASRYIPGVPFVPANEAAALAEVVIVSVPDDAVESIAEQLAESSNGRWISHTSGALGLESLGAAERAGGRIFLLHPLQTCPDVERAIERIPGSAVALTAREEDGYGIGDQLARAIGGRPFRLQNDKRAIYHAAAVFASNHFVTAEAIAERLFAMAGVVDPHAAMLPLVRATLDNVADLGPGAALTGPAVRGDVGTIRRNLEAIDGAEPQQISTYVEMARAALALAADAGRISSERRAAVEEELDRWK